jgi:hypothetical protein
VDHPVHTTRRWQVQRQINDYKQRLLYDAKYDVSAKGLISEALFMKWGSEGYLTIEKSSITDVQTEKSFLAKKVIVTLQDGSKHTFNYGALNVDKVADAIRQK